MAVVTAASRDDSLSTSELATLAVHFDSVLAIGLSDLDLGRLGLKAQ